MKPFLLLSLFALMPWPLLCAGDQKRDKPNIILIMADDLGYAGLGSHGQKLILTPELDKLVAESMCFTDYYAANTVCVASRVRLPQHP